MVAPRRKELLRSRRRIEDEGEEEEGSVVAGAEDDSLSEGSVISDADDDADAEGSDGSETIPSERKDAKPKSANSVRSPASQKSKQGSTRSPVSSSLNKMMADTEMMMNGLKFSGDVDEGLEVDFEDIGQDSKPAPQQTSPSKDPPPAAATTLGERRRREHEEYKKKRDADPAFVPNRGGFFMHDHRSAAPGQNGFKPFGRGRGRERGDIAGPPLSAGRTPQSSGPADAPWAHDLHETVVEPDVRPPHQHASSAKLPAQREQPKITNAKVPPPNRSFSRSTRVGNIQIRVFMAGMQEPVTVQAVPVYSHTRLPHHRPPLRRDKPVRISIPDMPIRYIFPAADRSFIFIPRAMRPNQQGFGRGRGRGSFSGGFVGFSSRRTSLYAGSNYSPSVALSRRSSLAREMSADALISPTGPPLSRPPVFIPEPSKPVVRLPPSTEQAHGQHQAQEEAMASATVPVVSLPQPTAYPPPQDPTFRENRPAPIPMHQPRPQKTVSVADIESPAFNPPQQQQQQPFHQQVPVQVSGQPYQPEAPPNHHSRHPSHPSQASGGTPLSQIPERAIHAQPFQPFSYQQPQVFYHQQYPPQFYYYPPPDPSMAGQPAATAPAFVPNQQYAYPLPMIPQAAAAPAEPTTQAGTVAHESNGMVYYFDSSQMNAEAGTNQPYPPPAYTMPPNAGVVGVGGMITPPVQFFPQPAAAPYYPPQ